MLVICDAAQGKWREKCIKFKDKGCEEKAVSAKVILINSSRISAKMVWAFAAIGIKSGIRRRIFDDIHAADAATKDNGQWVRVG